MRAVSAWCVSVILLVAGCGTDADGADDGGGTASASCVLRVTIDGVEWIGITMRNPLTRELRGPAVPATMPGCDDVNPGEDPSADDGRPVTLRAIEGLPPDEVLFLPGEGLDEQVFVPGPVTTLESLPAEVQELVRTG